jgi:hypothetical protein
LVFIAFKESSGVFWNLVARPRGKQDEKISGNRISAAGASVSQSSADARSAWFNQLDKYRPGKSVLLNQPRSNQCAMHPILPTAITNPIKAAISSQGLPLTASKIPVPRTTPIPIQIAKAQSSFMKPMLAAFARLSTADFP